MTKQKFGGAWTVEKLNVFSDYLDFYLTALKNQPFKLLYIDAFAGTGKIKIGEEENYEVIDGSAKLALQASGMFAEYILIEKKKSFAKELQEMVNADFPDRADRVKIINDDCNNVLKGICEKVDWSCTRAILLLDPYATNVQWETLECISKTEAIDLWYLFPFYAANRMLKKNGDIDLSWRKKLNSLFGDTSWEEELYEEDPQINLFGTETVRKIADTSMLKKYIETRLETIFPAVSKNSRILYNSNNSPLFLFCFAVSNKSYKAQGLAMKVANYILKDKKPN